MKKTWLILALLSLPAFSLNAAGLKRVLILDFKNVEEKPNYQYLESSITEAVAGALREKFAFTESPRQLWESVGKDNHIYEEDYHTHTAAMNLGLLSRQDVVIAGRYTIREKGNTTEIHTHVQIIDVNSQKVIAKFIEVGPADSRIFDSVNRIASRISEEAKVILPSKADWAQHGADEADTTPRYNLVAATMGLGIVSLPGSAKTPIDGDTAFVASDITNAFRLNLSFERQKIYRNFPLFVTVNLAFGSRTFENFLSSQPATGKLFGIGLNVGSGYEFDLWRRFSAIPYFLVGYYNGVITMAAPNDSDRKLDVSGPQLIAGGILTYAFNTRMQFRLNLGYETVWYKNGVSGSLILALGASHNF